MSSLKINKRLIDKYSSTYIIAELSANHNHVFERAVKLIELAKQSGADAIKLQTYTPDTITIDSQKDPFQIQDTIWSGRNLYDLYNEAYTPWEWQPKLKEIADEIGIDLFSTPFDFTAVDFLEDMDVPAYKIASFELVDIPLIRRVAQTGKPVIMSTGMATLAEIDEAVRAAREAGCEQLALLKCTSAYPAPPEEANLRTIPHLAEAFNVVAGLSDHTLGIQVPVAAVALGARIVEKHFTFARSDGGPDSAFSLEPNEFKKMVEAVRITEVALGSVHYGITEKDAKSRMLRRSLFVVEDVKAGDEFTSENVRSIRPGYGLHTRYLDDVMGRTASQDIDRGTPLSWECIG